MSRDIIVTNQQWTLCGDGKYIPVVLETVTARVAWLAGSETVVVCTSDGGAAGVCEQLANDAP